MDEPILRSRVVESARRYFEAVYPSTAFDPQLSPVPVSGKVLDADDLASLIEASLDLWLTTGRFAKEFENLLASQFHTRFAKLVNSGSSANLVALSTLTSEELGGKGLKPGDEIITAAAGFPTTLNPILQNGLVPVFVDSELATYDVAVDAVESAIGPRTRGIVLAHTLGNPFRADLMRELADQRGLWLIEDCCDALGASIGGVHVGAFGHLATVSFYPAHHITTGEGGAVLCGARFEKLVESWRDWGRACWCAPGCENTCGKRFQWQLGDLPDGYDHKYIYTRPGYNLKMTDMQAAIGISQLRKLPGFVAKRRENWALLRSMLAPFEEALILPEPVVGTEPSWFGFPITIRSNGSEMRKDIIAHLESRRISTRLLFGGNLVRQPAYQHINKRISGDLKSADKIMNDTFWVGVFPGLTSTHIEYMSESFAQYFGKRRSSVA